MTQRILTPRSQKVKVKARKSETSRLSGSSGLGRVVRLFRSNKENIAAEPPIVEESVYIVPHIQPGAELYPSVTDFAEFIFGLHRASDRYPSPEPASPFLKSHVAISSYDASIAPEIDQWRSVRTETYREEAARALDGLQNVLQENYPPGEAGDSETRAADSDSYFSMASDPCVVNEIAQQVQDGALAGPEAQDIPLPASPSLSPEAPGCHETEASVEVELAG